MTTNHQRRSQQRSGRLSASPSLNKTASKQIGKITDKTKKAAAYVSNRTRDLPPNAYNDAKNLYRKVFDTPLQAALGTFSFAVSLIGVLSDFGYDFAVGGSSTGGSSISFLGNFLAVNFPMRLVSFTMIVICISASAAFLGKLLTLNPKPLTTVTAHILTCLGALFLTGAFGQTFENDFQRLANIVLFTSVLGMGFSIFLAKMIYSSSHEENWRITTARTGLLANLAISTAFGFIIIFAEAS